MHPKVFVPALLAGLCLTSCGYEEPCELVYIEVVNHSPDEIFVVSNDGEPDTEGHCYTGYYGESSYGYYCLRHLFLPGERRTYVCRPHTNTIVSVWAKEYYPQDDIAKVPNAGLTMEEFNTLKSKEVHGVSFIRSDGDEPVQCRMQLDIYPLEEGAAKAAALGTGYLLKKYRMTLQPL